MLQDEYTINEDGSDPVGPDTFIMATITKRHVDPSLTTESLKSFVDTLTRAPKSLTTVLEARLKGDNTDKMVTMQVLSLDL